MLSAAIWQVSVISGSKSTRERKMIILKGSNEAFGLPEASPYVTKTDVHLKLAGLEYKKQAAMPMESPKGQVPFILDGGEAIAELCEAPLGTVYSRLRLAREVFQRGVARQRARDERPVARAIQGATR
jgi:hypothetical protein